MTDAGHANFVAGSVPERSRVTRAVTLEQMTEHQRKGACRTNQAAATCTVALKKKGTAPGRPEIALAGECRLNAVTRAS